MEPLDYSQTPYSTQMRERGERYVGWAAGAVVIEALLTVAFVKPPLPSAWQPFFLVVTATPMALMIIGFSLVVWSGHLEKRERTKRDIRLPLRVALFANHSGKLILLIVLGSFFAVFFSSDLVEQRITVIQAVGIGAAVIGILVVVLVEATRKR